jgi:hypothetical protein
VPALIVAASSAGDAVTLLAEHPNSALGIPFRPGALVQTAYRLVNLEAGQTVRRVWLRDGELVAEWQGVWNDQLPAVWRAALAPHLARGGQWEVQLQVDGETAAVQPFEIDTETLVIGELQFAIELRDDGRPAAGGHEFPHGTQRVYATFQVFNAPQDLPLSIRWVHDGAVVETAEIPWPGHSGPGSWQPVALPIASSGDQPLEPGDWRFALSLDGREILNDLFKILPP